MDRRRRRRPASSSPLTPACRATEGREERSRGGGGDSQNEGERGVKGKRKTACIEN
jgi:hypothetical protein